MLNAISPLQDGDLILSGTPPGAGPMSNGDEIKYRLEAPRGIVDKLVQEQLKGRKTLLFSAFF